MINILFINTNCSWNKGSAAQVISTTKTLRRLISNSNFFLISNNPELDFELCERHNIKIVGLRRKMCARSFSKSSRLLKLFTLIAYLVRCILWSTLCRIGLNANRLIDKEVLREYNKADLIVDLSGDTISDKGTYSVFALFGILIGILLKKKIVIFSQSIGPFRLITMPLARFCLNRADLIVVRENLTKNYLKEIDINNPSTYLAAEIAFLLEVAPPKTVQEIILKENLDKKNGPLIGIGASALIYRSFKSKKNVYIALMAKIANYLIEKLNAQVVFIPHVVLDPKYAHHDDRFVANEIYQLVRKKTRINTIKGDYSPEELKGIIGQFDLFIGARMHSNIASISMHVPTIVIAWSHKYYGIMRMLDMEKYVCDIETTTFNEIVTKIDNAWSNRNEIREKLASITTDLEESALYSGKLVKKLAESIF